LNIPAKFGIITIAIVMADSGAPHVVSCWAARTSGQQAKTVLFFYK